MLTKQLQINAKPVKICAINAVSELLFHREKYCRLRQIKLPHISMDRKCLHHHYFSSDYGGIKWLRQRQLKVQLPLTLNGPHRASRCCSALHREDANLLNS